MVDRKTLNKLLITVTSAFATIVPIVLALKPDTVRQHAGCTTLTPAHEAALASFRMINASCSYNITVNGIEMN